MKYTKTKSQEVAAAKSGMDVKTARKYIKSGQLPSEATSAHAWNTRADIFDQDWSSIDKILQNAPGLQAKTVMAHLLKQRPEHYKPNHLRTLRRRFQAWRASYGAAKAVIFR